MTATRNDPGSRRHRQPTPIGWMQDDLPFRHHAGRRSGYDD
ncbi:MAG: hypothetical protein QNJ09_13030 [Paracoccaceae bacterium]|nr:hypothetical protein [Paracoccaceae bacterium]